MKEFNHFYLDKEKDIIVHLFIDDDKMSYLIETPNHKSGNLITNFARLIHQQLQLNENGLKIIKGEIPCYVTSNNRNVYVMRLGGIKIANINEDGSIEVKASIPAICKTLMSQTKDYNLSLEETLVKTYIYKECKFSTDLHCHLNAILPADVLIALGIFHQIAYPYYYVKKIGLKITNKQLEMLESQRKTNVSKFTDSPLTGKALERRIDDNTFINFADLILNNLENADFNIRKIRASLTILKDGQAVFTNLEKVYLYRYVFTKGIESQTKIKLDNICNIPDKDIKNCLEIMINDLNNPDYCHNTILEDKLLWIGRVSKKHGIEYMEISDTTLVKDDAVKQLQQFHRILPLVEKETGVKIRFLAAMRRIPLTLIKDQKTPSNYLRDNLDVLKAVALDPYVVGSDFVGEEINDILELKPVISELVSICNYDHDFTIRIHAGENDALTSNVENALYCVSSSLQKGQPFPKMRIGHGIYTSDLSTAKGKKLLNSLRRHNVILEFQITSNVRLNNLSILKDHPIKLFLSANVNCVQGSDGFGLYGVDSFDEQLALMNLLHLTKEDMLKIKETETTILKQADEYFERKTASFNQFLAGRNIKDALEQQIATNKATGLALSLTLTSKEESSKVFDGRIADLPNNMKPVIVAGGSFNSDKRLTTITDEGKQVIDMLVSRLDPQNYFFVIGNKVTGYEKYLLQKARRRFKVFAIVPALVSESEKKRLLAKNLSIRVSTESLGMGIYKSFNYEIFERRESTLICMDGNSAAANLLQEAKNGKGKCNIYIYSKNEYLRQKALTLEGYVKLFNIIDDDFEI